MNVPKVYRILEIPYERKVGSECSLEYFIIPHKNKKYIIYFPLKGIVSLVNKDFIDKINTNNLAVKSLFKTVSKYPEVKTIKLPDMADSITLELTKACNLKCIYCYANGGDNPKYMDWKTAKAAIDYKIKHIKGKQFSIQFHGGGEPFLAFPMMKKCYDYAKKKCDKKGIKLIPTCTTNATLISENQVKWCNKIKMKFIISFDGTPELQNKQRPFRDGSPTYHSVEKIIKLFNKYKIDYHVNVSITKKSLTKITEIMKHINKLGINNITLSYVWDWGRSSKNLSNPNYKIFENAFNKAIKLSQKYKINILNEDKHRKKIPGICKDNCYACGHDFVITCYNDISSCFSVVNPGEPGSKELFYGKIRNGKIIINQKKLEHLKKRTIDNMPECKNCFAKYICSGGCLAGAARKTGTIYKQSKDECKIRKRDVLVFILDLLNQPTCQNKKLH